MFGRLNRGWITVRGRPEKEPPGQSGGSTPSALQTLGIGAYRYAGERERFALVHKLRVRIVKATCFEGLSHNAACLAFAKNCWMIANFTRALLRDWRAHMQYLEFNDIPENAVARICHASTVKRSTASALVRENHRDRALQDHVAGDPTEYGFPDTRVPIGTEHDVSRPKIVRRSQQRLCDRCISGGLPTDLRFDAVSREILQKFFWRRTFLVFTDGYNVDLRSIAQE